MPTNPPKTYECPAAYDSKATAKEAVAKLAISEGLLEFLKEQSVQMGTVGNPSGNLSNTLPKKRAACLAQLEEVQAQINGNGKRPLQPADLAVSSRYIAKLKGG